MTTATQETPWYFRPTTILIAGCLVAIINFGVRSTFGLFTLPISTAHQWPRETYSFAIALQNLMWGIGTPLAGMLADRYGSARVLMAGAVLYAVGVFGMNYSDSGPMMDFTAGLLVGLGIALSSFSIVMAALGRLVPPEKRSWAFGLATASGSMGQALFIWPVGQIVSNSGWNAGLVALAVSALVIIPLSVPLLVQNTSKSAHAKGETSLPMGQAVAEAFGHRSYLLLVAGFFVCGFQLAFITVHFPPYLAEHGISKEIAWAAMLLIGLCNVVGAYTSGIIGGRGVKRIPLSAIYLARAALYTLFILLPISTTTTLLFAAAIGLLWLSTVPLTMGLVTVMFGTRYMATLYGFVFLSHQIGSFLGVWLGGRLYDYYGSYDPVWWMSVALGVFAGIVHLPIREHRAQAFAAV
ncbi:MAG: MFS transporter [Alphaproteobacteria bacterium]|nr:MFS transporter [Alphaproteobacteria bacterium]